MISKMEGKPKVHTVVNDKRNKLVEEIIKNNDELTEYIYNYFIEEINKVITISFDNFEINLSLIFKDVVGNNDIKIVDYFSKPKDEVKEGEPRTQNLMLKNKKFLFPVLITACHNLGIYKSDKESSPNEIILCATFQKYNVNNYIMTLRKN